MLHCGLLNHDTKGCKVTSGGKIRPYGNWLRAEDPEIFTVPWSEEMEESGDFMLVTFAEEKMQPPSGTEEAETACKIVNTISNLNVPTIASEEMKRITTNCSLDSGGKSTVSNGFSMEHTTRLHLKLGLDILEPNFQNKKLRRDKLNLSEKRTMFEACLKLCNGCSSPGDYIWCF